MTVLKNLEIQKALGSDTKFKGINLNALNHNKVAPASPKSLYDDIVLRMSARAKISTGIAATIIFCGKAGLRRTS
jgi:hypothetical protein